MTQQGGGLVRRLARTGIATRLLLLFGVVAIGMTAVAGYISMQSERQVAELSRLNAELERKRLLIELEAAVAAYAALLDARQSLVLNQDFAGLPALKTQIAGTRAEIDGRVEILSAEVDVAPLRREIDALGSIHDRYLANTIEASFVPAANAQHDFARQRVAVIAALEALGPGGGLNFARAIGDLDDISQSVGITIGVAIPVTITLACLAFLVLLVSIIKPLRRLTDTIDRLDDPDGSVAIPEDGPAEFQPIGRALAALRDRLRAQKLAEERAVESARKLQQFTDATTDVLWQTGPDLRYNWVHASPERLPGIRKRVLGRTRWEAAGFDPDVDRHWGRHREDMLARRPFRSFDYFKDTQDESRGWWRVSGAPTFDDAGNFTGYRGAATNITEQKRYEEQLRRSQSMEMLGRLTSGVAHDFNNLLTVLSSNLEMLAERAALKAPFSEMVSRCERATRRGRGLTRQLLALGQRPELVPERVEVSAFLTEFGELVRRTLPPSIRVQITCDANLPDLCVDPGMLQDALLNLVLNARDAMPAGGKLRIRALPHCAAGEGQPVDPSAQEGVAICVVDTGCGIDQAVRDRVFEPFFTTKEKGQGTGLGLSMVRDFAVRSGGALELASTPGKGTTVTLVLPPETAAPSADPAAGVRQLDNTTTVLLVEDDRDLRETLGAILRFLGHEVLPFADFEQAAVAASTSIGIGALLCRANAAEKEALEALAKSMRLANPGAIILLTVDDALDGATSALISDLSADLIRMPVATDTLRMALADAPQTDARSLGDEDPHPG